MQCFFVSRDYLQAVSSTVVDRHGRPFRDRMFTRGARALVFYYWKKSTFGGTARR